MAEVENSRKPRFVLSPVHIPSSPSFYRLLYSRAVKSGNRNDKNVSVQPLKTQNARKNAVLTGREFFLEVVFGD